MSTHFRNLAEDCVQLIFDRIATHQLLLNARRVCHAWRRHQQLNCRRRKSLIFRKEILKVAELNARIYNKPFTPHNIDQDGNAHNYKCFIDHNRIRLSVHFKPTTNVRFIIETFPHLRTLIVSMDRSVSQHIQAFISLIAHYSTKLVTLQLYFSGEIRRGTHLAKMNKVFGDLFAQINLLPQLEHLTFYVEDTRLEGGFSPPIGEPKFMTRIKEFNFDCFGLVGGMIDWMRKYDQAGQLGQLTRIYLEPRRMLTGNSLSERFAYPLVNLYSRVPFGEGFYDENEERLKQIVTIFPSLTTITFTFLKLESSFSWVESNPSLAKLSTILCPLTKLVHAQLNIGGSFSSIELFSLNCVDQLKSIKALDLKFFNDFRKAINFYQTQVPIIVYIFPNLQSIRINNPVPSYSFEDIDAGKELAYCEQFFDDLKAAYGRESLRTEYELWVIG